MKKVGICFSKELEDNNPLSHIKTKYPVYLRLLEFMQEKGWEVYVLTRKTYLGNGKFDGGWLFDNGKFNLKQNKLKIDLVYDRTGGIYFPLENDNLKVVNNWDFKVLAWNKWKTYQEIGEYMPKTYWVGDLSNTNRLLRNIGTDLLVLKPYNGLKGLGIFIGNKTDALKFSPEKKYQYILQEFIDTSSGIPGITSGNHDLRVVIVNAKPVWCHVRVPQKGSLLANAAQGGNLTEVDYEKIPEVVKKIVTKIAKLFYEKFDNPVFSLDFGMDKDRTPKIFEINDQIGFPKWEMKNRDIFLKALIANFESKI